jgi:hypothetical protein
MSDWHVYKYILGGELTYLPPSALIDPLLVVVKKCAKCAEF